VTSRYKWNGTSVVAIWVAQKWGPKIWRSTKSRKDAIKRIQPVWRGFRILSHQGFPAAVREVLPDEIGSGVVFVFTTMTAGNRISNSKALVGAEPIRR